MSLAAGLIQCLMGVAFLAYGASCLSSPRLAAEFERFGLGRFRILTGWLEIAGGAGLLAGLMWPALGAAAAAGLAALMGLGVWSRMSSPDLSPGCGPGRRGRTKVQGAGVVLCKVVMN